MTRHFQTSWQTAIRLLPRAQQRTPTGVHAKRPSFSRRVSFALRVPSRPSGRGSMSHSTGRRTRADFMRDCGSPTRASNVGLRRLSHEDLAKNGSRPCLAVKAVTLLSHPPPPRLRRIRHLFRLASQGSQGSRVNQSRQPKNDASCLLSPINHSPSTN